MYRPQSNISVKCNIYFNGVEERGINLQVSRTPSRVECATPVGVVPSRARSNIEDLGHIVAEIDSPDGTFIHPDSGSGNRYFRFHGRNKRGWEGNSSNPSDRYNYYYGKDELHILARYVKESIERGDEIFVYFNNHPYGNAPRNAIEFSEILGLGRPGNQKQLI